MSSIESIIKFLQFKMTTPESYGVFHIICIIITILLIIFLNKKKYNLRKTLLTMSLIMIGFEIYKQLSFSFNNNTWFYQWYIFPFQFCSTPMYIALISSITKNEKLKNSLYSFLATYGLIGGLSVMVYPNTVFITETLINVQTMVHHGFMIVMGTYILLTNNKLNIKSIKSAIKVFLILVTIALSIDIITYYININNGLEMFYISPFHQSSLPILSIIYEKVPYIIFLIIYILIFTLGSSIPLIIKKKLERKKNER